MRPRRYARKKRHLARWRQKDRRLRNLHPQRDIKGIETYLFISPIFPYITNLREIIDLTVGKVNKVCFENLNLRGAYKSTIMDYINKVYPQYLQTYDELYNKGISAGAIGGKLLGAGGGGFIMFFVEPTKKKAVLEALGTLGGYTIHFNFTDGGAHGWKIYETDRVESLKH